jgi:hypothetical protein
MSDEVDRLPKYIRIAGAVEIVFQSLCAFFDTPGSIQLRRFGYHVAVRHKRFTNTPKIGPDQR